MSGKDVFVCRSRCRLGTEEEAQWLQVHQALCEFVDRSEELRSLVSTFVAREGSSERLELTLEAASLEAARGTASALFDGMIEVVAGRFGEGLLHAGQVEVVPAEVGFDDDLPEALLRMLAETEDSLGGVARREPLGTVCVERPPARLPARIVDLLDDVQLGCEVYTLSLGLWAESPSELASGPWRREDDVDVAGLPRASVISIEGARLDVPASEALKLVRTLAPELDGLGWMPLLLHDRVREWMPEERAFRTTRIHGAGQESVGILPVSEPLQLLRFFGTNGASFELSTADVIRRFKDWRERSRFRLVSCGPSHATLVFEELPRELLRFAEEVYAFAPDALDQNYVGLPLEDPSEMEWRIDLQTPQDLADSLGRGEPLRLLWD